MIESKTIAIVGGGIGGLTLAVALRQKGVQVNVFESSPEIKPLGAGIVLAANAMKALREIGLEKRIIASGMEVRRFCIRDAKGNQLTCTDAAKISARYGLVNSLTMHRAELHRVLLENLADDTIHLRKNCIGFTADDSGVDLEFDDSTTFSADYVIAADGINSIFRKNLLPETTIRYSGYTCWRGVIPEFPPGFTGEEATEVWGAGKRFGMVPLSGNRIYWYATVNAKARDPRYEQFGPSEIRNLFEGFYSPVHEIIGQTAPSQLIRNDINDVVPLRRFAFGRIALMGDAAHPTTPNLGQGACMAIEDAVVLANLITGTPEIEEAFRVYEQVRIARTTKIVDTSWKLGRIGQLSNPLLVTLRNTAFRLTPERISDRQLDFLFNVSFS